jgi:hypothetical protein
MNDGGIYDADNDAAEMNHVGICIYPLVNGSCGVE